MDPPQQPSYWKQEAIKIYVGMGLRPQVADFVFESTKFAYNSAFMGVVLAVLVSLFCDDALWGMFAIYFVCQQDFFYHICYEVLYFATFDGHVSKCLPRLPILAHIFWPVVGYAFAGMTIRTVEFVFWVLGLLISLFLMFSALLSATDIAMRQIAIGMPRDPRPFVDLVVGLPWESYINRIRELSSRLGDLYRDHIHKRLFHLWAIYRIHIHRRLLIFGFRMLQRFVINLVRLYLGFQWLKKHVGHMIQISTPTAIYIFQATRAAVEFALALLVIPERHRLMYHYKPLAEEDFRLLRLTRRGLFGGFKKSLIHVPLKELPAYECISYAWGDSTKTHSILIDGLQFPVSTNVYNILRERASIWSSRHLWIDAICINQMDNKEKTRQVCQMRTIYKSADRVTIYLGNPPDARLAENLLQKLVLRMTSYEITQQWQPILGSCLRHQEVRGGSPPEEWLALKRLFSNPWFERAWVVQEVTMASQIYVLYGGRYLDWEVLMSVMQAFFLPEATMLRSLITRVDDNHLGALPPGLQNGMMMGAFRSSFQNNQTIRLDEILRGCLAFRATERKDKIFALQGITLEAAHPSLSINYDLEDHEVLMNTARYFLKTPQSLQILQLAGIGWERDHKDIPSWVVDWTMTRPAYIISYSNFVDSPTSYKAAKRIPPCVVHNEAESPLIVKGLPFDEIDELGDPINFLDHYMHNETPVDLREINKMWVSWFRRAEDLTTRKAPNPYHTGQPRLEAFWRTMIGDKDTSRPANPEYYYNYLEFREGCIKKHVEAMKGMATEAEILTEADRNFLRHRDKDPRPSNSAFVGVWAFSNAIGSACNDRRFAVTKKGYLAMVPKLAEAGDRVCLIFGADVPFILRKAPLQKSRDKYGDRQCYYLVGESFVHGIMDGEGLEGLLRPEEWKEVEDFVVL